MRASVKQGGTLGGGTVTLGCAVATFLLIRVAFLAPGVTEEDTWDEEFDREPSSLKVGTH